MNKLSAGLLSKAYSTLKHKTHTLSEEQLNAFETLSRNIEEAAARMKDDPTQVHIDHVYMYIYVNVNTYNR
jgi:hypothetical protein